MPCTVKVSQRVQDQTGIYCKPTYTTATLVANHWHTALLSIGRAHTHHFSNFPEHTRGELHALGFGRVCECVRCALVTAFAHHTSQNPIRASRLLAYPPAGDLPRASETSNGLREGGTDLR